MADNRDMLEKGGRLVATGWLLLALAGTLAALGALWLPRGRVSPKKLVQFGWDQPTPAFLRQHLWEMEREPFDGVVVGARYLDAAGQDGSLEWTAFGRTAIPWSALEPQLRELRGIAPRHLTHNFLRFNVTPGSVDWFDDFGPILHNARLTARLVQQGRLKGILLDVEQYREAVFRLADRQHLGRHGASGYEAQVRRRGRELMQAFQSEAPGLVVFSTFGYSLASTFPDDYGLLRPFLDGLFEAAEGETRFVDGFEFSYPYRGVAEFEKAYRIMHEGGRARSAVPVTYSARLLAGFGLWMDYDWRRLGWSTADPRANHFTPQQLENALAAALRRSDRYVWLYNEQPRWWTDERLPEAYRLAVRRARLRAGLDRP